jgi:uncharacterized SAM-binding protein YcdF (DUF218 family)
MFFILSKTITFLVMPFTLVIILLLLSGFWKHPKWKKRFFWTAMVLLLFFSNDFIAQEFMRAWEVKTKAYKDMKPHDLGIVLTGATMQLLKPDDRVYFSRGADRVTHTVQLYKLGLIRKILISGGTGTLKEADEPEANKFKKAMIMMGVPEGDILIENKTRNTYESAVEVSKMLDSMQFKAENCLLITSAFHMRRSLACYRKANLDIEPFSTDFYTHPRFFYPDGLLIPSIDAIVLWHKLFKEWLGFIAYKMAGYI